MQNDILLDTNIVIRLLVRDNEEHFLIAELFFKELEEGKKSARLIEIIIGEIVYVLKSVYKQDKSFIKRQLELLFSYEKLYIENHFIVSKALEIYANKNIDFADAMLCAKKNLENYEVMSFDKDLKRC